MSERRCGIHPLALIGEPPEHREFNADPSQPTFAPEIHPSAQINAFVTIDAGLKRPTRIGKRAFLMTKVHVGHDAIIGDDVELATGTIICGHAELGPRVRVGVGAIVQPFVKVGEGVRIGSGAVVTKDVEPGVVVAGNPARILRKLTSEEQQFGRQQSDED